MASQVERREAAKNKKTKSASFIKRKDRLAARHRERENKLPPSKTTIAGKRGGGPRGVRDGKRETKSLEATRGKGRLCEEQKIGV